MVQIHLKGVYGSSFELDDDGVTFLASSRLAKGALGAAERRIVFADITDRSFKAATFATNGHIEVVTEYGKSIFHFMFGKGAKAATEAFDVLLTLTPDAGEQTKGRGLTTKTGVEGATLKDVIDAGKELSAAVADLKTAMQEERLQSLFPGLRFHDMTATYAGLTQPIAGATAVVDSAGALSQRPTLTRVALGAVLFGGVGAIGGGLLQKKTDTRQVFILIDGPLAAWTVPVKPDQFGDAQRFAGLFNTAAKHAGSATAEGAPPTEQPPAAAPSGLTEKLASLAALHEQGVLSDDEFTQAKTAVLRGE